MLKALVKDTSIYGMIDFIFKFVNIAIFPIIAHYLSVSEFGVFALATTLASLIAVTFNCGLTNAVQRYYTDPVTREEEQPQFVVTGLLTLVVLSLFIGGISLFVTYVFKEDIYNNCQLPWILILLAIIGTLPTQIFQFSVDLMRLHFRPWKFALFSALQNTISVTLSLIFVTRYQWGISGYLLGVVVASMAVAPLSLWSIRRSLVWSFSWNKCKKLVSFGYPFIFAGIAYWIFGSMDRWMLAELSTTEEVGIYSTAFRIATIIIFINTAFGQAWSPHALMLYRSRPDYRTLYSNFFTMWFFFLTITATGLSLFSVEALRILMPQEYWSASQVVPYITFGMVLFGTTQITAIGISLEKKTYHFSISTWITAVVNFILNLYLIPIFGPRGAAFATFIAYGILTTYYLICTQAIHPLPLEYRKLFWCLVIFFGSLVFSVWVNSLPWSAFLTTAKLICFALLPGLGFMIGIYRLADFSSLVKIVRNRTKVQA